MSSAILTESKTEKGLPWCREDTLWVLGIYGTAVGSGSARSSSAVAQRQPSGAGTFSA